MTKTFESCQFKPMVIGDTAISVWQERDRLHIELRRISDDRTLVEWRDDDAYQAIEDGFLDTSEAILGSLERHIKQGGRLHQSVFDYWRERIKR